MYAKLSSRTLWLFMCSISICLNSGLMSLSNETGIFSLPADVSYCSSPLESCDAAAAETNPGPFCASCNFSINIGRNLGSDRIRRPLAGDLLQERNHAVIPFANWDHQIELGATWKMIDVRLTVRSVWVQRLHHLLIRSNDHDVWPNVKFAVVSHRT